MNKLQFTLPFLRFKGFNDNWIKSKITKITDIITGITYNSNDLNDNGKYFVVRANNINSDKFINNNFIRINIDNVKQKFFLKENDILICSNSGSKNLLGKNCLIENVYNDYLIGGFMMVFRNYDPIVYPLLKTNRWKRYIQLDNSSTINSITKDKLNHIYFYIPFSIEEKKKIFLFFRLIDEHIELWERKLQLYLLKKKHYLNSMFSNDTSLPFLRFKGFDDNWTKSQIDHLYKITRGYVLSKNDMSDKFTNKHIYPVFSSQTLNNGIVGYYYKYLYQNSIIWTTDGANAGTVKYIREKFYCTNVCGVLISNDYCNEAMSAIIQKHCIKFVSKQLGNPKLMNNTMGKIKIIYPKNIKEQAKISKFLLLLDKNIKLSQENIDNLKIKKLFYINKMFI